MYLNTGYLNHSHMDFKDKSRPLIVGSCGTYRLSRHPKLPTYRPRGRLDYQIIYITAGCGHFHFDNVNNETIVPAGNIVLYRPKELQKYEYYGEDKTEVYWIHFTGSNVKNILRQYGFPDKERVFQVGTSNEYEQIFKRIIIELQRCQDNYEEMLVLLLRHLLISFHRELTREHILKNEYLDHEMDNAVTFFSENYNQNINIDDYAASRGMECLVYPKFQKNIPVLHQCNSLWESASTMLRCYLKQQLIPSMRFLRLSDMITSFISVGFFTEVERNFRERIPRNKKKL